jgi:hypothetical protein
MLKTVDPNEIFLVCIDTFKEGIGGLLMQNGHQGFPTQRNEHVPSSEELRNLVMKEMHDVPYAGHPSYQKIVTVVRS